MPDTIEARVHQVLIDQLGLETEQIIDDAKLLDDLGADSLDTVELIMTFEEEFGIDISDEEAEQLKTVKQVIDHIKEKVSAKGSPDGKSG